MRGRRYDTMKESDYRIARIEMISFSRSIFVYFSNLFFIFPEMRRWDWAGQENYQPPRCDASMVWRTLPQIPFDFTQQADKAEERPNAVSAQSTQ
jgi:hypothetical protein